ncbi:hypothetical protein IWX90DRAFT_8788 [Phyllosticta citrichinensis]|uniref:Secreted protein n=1 Tax=Phyllosticta citrichinensis TaxID=1130410 RepID=A0ABR1Y647_9PEZI
MSRASQHKTVLLLLRGCVTAALVAGRREKAWSQTSKQAGRQSTVYLRARQMQSRHRPAGRRIHLFSRRAGRRMARLLGERASNSGSIATKSISFPPSRGPSCDAARKAWDFLLLWRPLGLDTILGCDNDRHSTSQPKAPIIKQRLAVHPSLITDHRKSCPRALPAKPSPSAKGGREAAPREEPRRVEGP